jgi:2-polyprenyl-3-methyl-5-hydroxy-6-metoxy-1,4-benzoquinol methylase
MQSERTKWNARYEGCQDDRLEADPYLIESYTKFASPLFPRQGRALDLAGGMGRHAIWLARQGWNTTLLDISPVALDAARKWSSREHLWLEFVEADLDDYRLPEDAFDLITVFNFLQRSLFLSLQQCLCPGGVIIYKTRMQSTTDEDAPDTLDYLLRPGELPRIFSGFGILDYRTGIGQRGPIAALVARKPLV